MHGPRRQQAGSAGAPARTRATLLAAVSRVARVRAILGSAMVLLALLAWEGLERGWWADALHPLLGEAAERLREADRVKRGWQA